MSGATSKQSYTIPCASAFRDAVEDLAAKRRVNAGDIARSVLLLAPTAVIATWPDPGEPPAGDREIVELKSGPSAGRPWRRKPRLQVRMPPGQDVPFIRRALALALALDQGRVAIDINDPARPEEPPPPVPPEPEPEPPPQANVPDVTDEVERLRAVISVLAFEPLNEGVRSRDEALHVLGFPPGADPDSRTIRAKFRMLATIHHPDNALGSHQRMSQLNQAMTLLRDLGRR